MKFEEWKILTLNENLANLTLKNSGEKVKSKLEKSFDKLYAIPDFETFSRKGEPYQKSVLFTDKELHTFSYNYTLNGNLYSVDFWKPSDKSSTPSFTMYTYNANLEDILLVTPDIAKNPNKNININKILMTKKTGIVEKLGDSELELSSPKPKIDSKIKSVQSEYDFSDPETVFEDLKTYVKMVIEGKQPSLIITGSPGVGKTYLVTKQLKDSNTDYVHIKGRSTAAGMYTSLYDNNGKVVLFDDCDSVFGSDDAVNVLKGALDSYGERKISWLVGRPLKSPTTGKPVPTSFEFTGRVIFISNLPQRKIDDAIKSRSFVIEVALTPEDMINKMRKELPFILPDTPLYLKRTALGFIERISSKTESLELNMRTLIKAIKIIEEVDDLSVAERLIMQQCSYK